MKLALTPRLQRILALAIAGFLALILLAWIAAPMWAAASEHATILGISWRASSAVLALMSGD